MPRVLVITDDRTLTVVDELVNPEHLDTDPGAQQLIERLAEGIEDASRREAAFRSTTQPRSYRQIPAG